MAQQTRTLAMTSRTSTALLALAAGPAAAKTALPRPSPPACPPLGATVTLTATEGSYAAAAPTDLRYDGQTFTVTRATQHFHVVTREGETVRNPKTTKETDIRTVGY